MTFEVCIHGRGVRAVRSRVPCGAIQMEPEAI
jgi:hypothetical protein